MNLLKSQLHILHVFKETKPQDRRTLLTSASDQLIKDIVECAINTLNANHKLTKEDKIKLSKYKNRLQALVKSKINFKIQRKILIQMGEFIIA